jgi:hypothetical protein
MKPLALYHFVSHTGCRALVSVLIQYLFPLVDPQTSARGPGRFGDPRIFLFLKILHARQRPPYKREKSHWEAK